MEYVNKAESYHALIRACSELVKQYGLHSSDGPVNLQPLVEDIDFNIEVIYTPLKNGWHGYAVSIPEDNIPAQIVINCLDLPIIQFETLAHEIVHLIKHACERVHRYWEGNPDSIQEFEALHGAAYLLVPFGYLLEMAREGHSAEVIAAELGVRKELVEIRWRMAIEYDELKNLFDFGTSEPDKGKITDFPLQLQNNDELEVVGKAKIYENIKVPIGEVKPHQMSRHFNEKTEYGIVEAEIGNAARIAWWLGLENRDYNEEEI